MAKNTNCTVKGNEYYRITRKVGMKLNADGIWVDHRKDFYGTCKSDAENKFKEYMERQSKGTLSNDCVGTLIDNWIDTVYMQCEHADSTKVKYTGAYNRIFRPSKLAGMKVGDITALDIQELYNQCTECYSSRRALHNLLRLFFKYAELNNYCRDLTRALTVPRQPKKAEVIEEIEVWQDDELKRLIAALEGATLRFLVVLAVNTGMRFGELLALQYSDIKDGVVYVNKQLTEPSKANIESGNAIKPTKTSSSNRIIPLAKLVLEEFEKHKALHQQQMIENGYVTDNIFTTSHGTYYWQRNISRSIKRTCEREHITYHHFHCFRHTFATNLCANNVKIEETSKLLGHSSITMTLKYYVLVQAQAKQYAVESIVSHSLTS